MNPEDTTHTPPSLDGDDTDCELMAGYLAGMLDPAARERVDARLRADPIFRGRFEEARFAWLHGIEAYDVPVSRTDAARAWALLNARIDAAEAGAESRAPRRVRRLDFWRSLGAAASRWRRGLAPALPALAATAVLALGIGAYVATRRTTPAPSTAAGPTREIVAPAGTVSHFQLSDGTQVWMAPGSVLRAPDRFGAGSRAVSLSGRAFFSVAHEPARPFTVEAGGSVTRVVGTEFDVDAYPDDAEVAVTVRSGTVAVRAVTAPQSSATVLVDGMRGTVHPQRGVRVTEGADLDVELAWMHGRLVFDRRPLREVATELERWAGLGIRITDDSVERLRLTAEFDGEPTDSILNVVTRLLEIEIEREGTDVVISPR